MERINFFSADYRDGRITVGGKTYPAGTFATHLLNQFYIEDTAARLSVFISNNWMLQKSLRAGYLNRYCFDKAGWEIQQILHNIPKLQPFCYLDVSAEIEWIKRIFTDNVANYIVRYFRMKSKVLAMDEDHMLMNALPPEYDEEFFRKAEELLEEVIRILRFYDRIGEDIRKSFRILCEFVDRSREAERFDEVHLLPIALEVCGEMILNIKTEYAAVKKNAKSKGTVTARRMYFDNYFSFVMTDFFEGLHHGHYPRECPICGKYFLMTSAKRQMYCNGYAPVLLKGKKITCRKYAARMSEKERAADNPITVIYRNRTSAIRVERSRGKITEEFADATLRLAKENWQRAKFEDAYAEQQYARDMERTNLYIETDKRIKENVLRR